MKNKALLLLMLFSLIAFASQSQDKQMVAHWPMDEGSGSAVTDVVGGNNGTIVGTLDWISGGGIRFNNIDGNHVEIPNSSAIDFGDVDFSITMWIRYLTPPETTDRLLIKGTHGVPGSGSRYEVFVTSGGTVRFTIDNGFDNLKSKLEVPGEPFFTGDWVFVVAIRDAVNDELALYANGELLGVTVDQSGDISNEEPLWIGESTDEAETAMSGDIKDVSLFNYALSESEVTGIDSPNENPISVYPNPFTNSLEISNNTNINSISVYNISGQEVRSINDVNASSITLNVGDLKNGLYFVKMVTVNNEFTTKVVLKK